jgi:hypothetical protein
MVWALLRGEGFAINRKRIERTLAARGHRVPPRRTSRAKDARGGSENAISRRAASRCNASTPTGRVTAHLGTRKPAFLEGHTCQVRRDGSPHAVPRSDLSMRGERRGRDVRSPYTHRTSSRRAQNASRVLRVRRRGLLWPGSDLDNHHLAGRPLPTRQQPIWALLLAAAHDLGDGLHHGAVCRPWLQPVEQRLEQGGRG